MAAVRVNLPIDFVEQDASPGGCPPRARRQLRQCGAHGVERQRFSGQVGVGAEVVGQVPLDVRELVVEPDEHVDDPWRCWISGLVCRCTS